MIKRKPIMPPMMGPIGRDEDDERPGGPLGPVGDVGATIIDVTTPSMVTICIEEVAAAPAARDLSLVVDIEEANDVVEDSDPELLAAVLELPVVEDEVVGVGVKPD